MDLQTAIGVSTIAIYGIIILSIALTDKKPQITTCDKCKGCKACRMQIHEWNGTRWEKKV